MSSVPDQSRAPRRAQPVNQGAWQMLRGRMARVLGQPQAANPHAAGGAAWRCWDFGWRADWTTRGRLAGRGRAAGGMVGDRATRGATPGATRATAGTPGRGVGRGRAVMGDRGEWAAADVAVVRLCMGGSAAPATADVAALLNKSEAAVRAMKSRLRKEEKTP